MPETLAFAIQFTRIVCGDTAFERDPWWIAMTVDTYRSQEQVAHDLEGLGVSIFPRRDLPRWVQVIMRERGYGEIIGVAFHDGTVSEEALVILRERTRVETVMLNQTDIHDDRMSEIVRLSHLKSLCLVNTAVTDAGVAQLAECDTIQVLDLSGTEISNDGLAHLAKFPCFKVLAIDNTNITDEGLAHLAKLSQLHTLYIMNAKVTDAGIADLRRAIGQLQVVQSPTDPVLFPAGLLDECES